MRLLLKGPSTLETALFEGILLFRVEVVENLMAGRAFST